MAKSNREKRKEKLELITKIDETDDMKLKLLTDLNGSETQDNMTTIYPPELNSYLIDELKTLTSENGSLRKCMFTKDSEIKELEKTIHSLKEKIRDIISSNGPVVSLKSAGVISDKISALCKQNRHLVAEVESYKSKISKLEQKLKEFENKSNELEKPECCQCTNEPVDYDPDEFKELNNKLCAVNKKLFETKNKNLELKNDILIATKILQQELGEKFTNIKELQNDIAGWKGRAQQIILLQAKIQELEEKLNRKQKDNNETKEKDHVMQKIREHEIKKKNEVDQAMKELEKLKQENTEVKRKLDGSRCRIRNLECDIGVMKQKIQTFTEKSQHDDLLIKEQRNQIKKLELHYEEVLSENTCKINSLKSEAKDYKTEISNNDLKVEALCDQISEKTQKVQNLQEQLDKYKKCSLQAVFFTPMKLATENEIAKLSELVLTLNKRLEVERERSEYLDKSYREAKEKKNQFKKKLNKLEHELSILKNTKKGPKMERSTSLKGFNGESNESQISKKNSLTSYNSLPENCQCGVIVDELKSKLELSQERIKIMEDKLKMITEEKMEDYQTLTNMIQTSKQYFNEALTALKGDKCPCPL